MYYNIGDRTLRYLILIFMLFSTTVQSEVNFSGSLYQSYLKSTGNNYFSNDSTDGSFDRRNGLLNVNYKINNTYRLFGNVSSEYPDDLNGLIGYGFLSSRFEISNDKEIEIQIGRVKQNQGLIGNSFIDPSVNGMMMLPGGVYNRKLINSLGSLDGVLTSLDGLYDELSYKVSLGYGKVVIKDQLELNDTIFGRPVESAKFDTKYDSWTSGLELKYKDLRLKYEHSDMNGYLDVDGVDWSSLNPVYSVTHKDEEWNTKIDKIGLEYRFIPLDLRYRTEYIEFNTKNRLRKINPSIGNYHMFTYYGVPNSSITVGYSESHSDKYDRDGKITESLFGLPSHSMYGNDRFVTYKLKTNNVTKNSYLIFEYHNINGSGWGIPSEQDRDNSVEDSELFMITFTKRFY